VEVMGKLGAMYGVQDAGQEFLPQPVIGTKNGYRHVRLNQTYKGLPVFGGQVIVHFDGKGTARSVNGAYMPLGELDVTSTLTADQARVMAQADQKTMGKPVGVVAQEPELVVFARGTVPKPAWQLVITYNGGSGNIGRWRYWINALTGEILLKINDVPNAAPIPDKLLGAPAAITGSVLTGQGGGVVGVEGWAQAGYSFLYSFTNLWFVRNVGGFLNGTDGADAVANRLGTTNWGTTDRVEISASHALEGIQWLYRTNFGRNSYDNLGSIIEADVHYGVSYVNAFWDGSVLTIGDGDGGVNANSLAVLDVMGHELQHAVTEYSAGLIYADESGALNESFSDIFGTLDEFALQPDGRAVYPKIIPGHSDWLLGEDCWTASTALRDMRNPANANTVGKGNEQPTRYQGKYWDFGGEVHQNDSVQNFFFYLLCEGGSGTNDGIFYYVPGVGIEVGGQLAYNTLTAYMTPSTDYAAARDAWVASAQEFDDRGVTTNAVISATLAWAAVGLGTVSLVFPADSFVVGRSLDTGEYSRSNQVYIMLNPSPSTNIWSVSINGPWLTVTPVQVTNSPLDRFAKVTITVDTTVADTLPKGIYTDTIRFSNNSGAWDETRQAVLHVGTNYVVRGEPYNWIDPVANNHSLLELSSGISALQTLPFDVLFYDVTNRSIYVSAFGTVGFSFDGLATSDNTTLPNWQTPNSIICPYWDAVNATRLPALVYYGIEGTAPHRKAVVTWLRAPHDMDAAAQFSFQMIVEENPSLEFNSDIVFNYKDVDESNMTVGAGISATVGVEDQFGALGKQFSYNNLFLADNTALRFSQVPSMDTTAPTGQVRFLGQTDSDVFFEIRFNEPVEGLTEAGLSLSNSTVAGIAVSLIRGGGFRYVVSISPVVDLGRVELSVLAGAVHDMSGNANLAFGSGLYVVQPQAVNFADDMESGPSAWTASTQVFDLATTKGWEWGKPDPSYVDGPAGAHSGENCWGTILDGPFPDAMDAWVMTEPISVGAYPVLDFYVWYGLGEYGDYGYVEVNAGNGWVNVTPGDYSLYYSSSGGWLEQVVPLDNAQFGNCSIQVRFRVKSKYNQANYAIFNPGMYVDDMKVSSRRDPGVWVVNYTPEGGMAPSTNVVTLTAYNSSTNTYTGVSGVVGSSEPGVNFISNSVAYGTLMPGDLVNGVAPVGVILGSAGNFTKPIVQLTHDSKTGLQILGKQAIPFNVSNVTVSAVATNVITVKSSLSGVGVTNWLGQYLQGDGGMTSCLYQVIYAGTNGVKDPPLANGQVTGDDCLLYSSSLSHPWGLFGEGGVPSNQGQFKKLFNQGLPSNAFVYVRAYDASSFDSSVAYGDSALYALNGQVTQTHDFGCWLVGTPLNPSRDSNGDSITDGYSILHGMDPRAPIVKLASGWTLLQQLGSAGSGAGQFSSGTPSPTRVFYKGNFLYVLDTGHNKLQVWNRFTNKYVGSYGSTGNGAGQFSRPYGLGFDPRPGINRFAVADQGNARVQVFQFDPATGTNITYVFTFGTNGCFVRPTDVAIAPDGRFYVTDLSTTTDYVPGMITNYAVQAFTEAGDLDSILALYGSHGGEVMNAWGVTVGTNGMVVVADTENNRIQAWDAAGNYLWQAGSFGTNADQLSMPRDAAFGPGDMIYVTDTGNSRLAVYSTNGTPIATLGSHGYSFDVQMVQPYSSAPVVDSNVVYVADTLNNRILAVAAIFDTDGDGMDDVWEILHGLDPRDPADGLLDSNGNGISNIGEYRLQQDPLQMSLTLRIKTFSMNPALLSWEEVVTGGIYRVEYSLDHVNLATNSWQAGPTVTSGVAGIMAWTNTLSVTNGVEYFRVIRLSP